MHRLRTRRKIGKEAEAAKDDSTTSSNVFSSKAFKRNKSQPPPATRQPIDLAAALPSQDDFRISLMMPNLEQRFSVLRDEKEKEMKAAAAAAAGPGVHGMGYGALASGTLSLDESAKDFSRPPFGKGSLQDIAETASISSSHYGRNDDSRKNSQSDDSSVMTRPRPGEGNVLFGGRQKVYRINTASERATEDGDQSPLASPTGKKLGGRALFSDDLPGGSFVSERQRERERRDREKEEKAQQRSRSPAPSNYNHDRNTTSSNDSGPTSLTRSSTAATSVGSHSNIQPSGGMASKPRRAIYEQALDRDLHDNYSNQKLEIISQRRFGSTSPVGERGEEVGTSRPISPPLRKFARPLSPDSGREDESRGRSASPVLKGSLSTRNAALNSLRGHGLQHFATPTKPVQSLEPSPSNLATFDFGINDTKDQDASPASFTLQSGLPTPREGSSEFEPLSVRKITQVHGEPSPLPSPMPKPENRQEQYLDDVQSNRSFNSRGSSNEFVAGRQSTRTSSKTSASQQHSAGSFAGHGIRDTSVDGINNQSTFFDAPSDSEVGMDDKSDYGDEETRSQHESGEALYNDLHYAQHNQKFRNIDNVDTSMPAISRPSIAVASSPTSIYPREDPKYDIDSPTLPASGGLSSMVREHLRSDSGASSVYPQSVHHGHDEHVRNASNTLGYEDWDEHSMPGHEYEQTMVEPKAHLTLAELKKKEALERQQREVALATLKHVPTMDDDLRPGSNESNDDWANELAQRRKAVQQKLQGHSGRNSLVPSANNSDTRLPLPEPENPSPVQINDQILGMLRSKASSGLLEGGNGGRDDSKAMKLLGISGDAEQDHPPLSPTGQSHGRIRARFRPQPKGGMQPGPQAGEPRPRQGPPPTNRSGLPPVHQGQQRPQNGPPGPGQFSTNTNQGPPRQAGPHMLRDQQMPNGRGMRPPHERPYQDSPPHERPPHDRRPYPGKPIPSGPPSDLRPPHDRAMNPMGPGPMYQPSPFQGPMNQPRPVQGRHRSPSLVQNAGGSPQRNSPPRYPPVTNQAPGPDRTRSNEELHAGHQQRRPDRDFQQTRNRKRSDAQERPPMSTVNSDPMPMRRRESEKDDLKEAMANGRSSHALADSFDGDVVRQGGKASQEALVPMENVQSRFSTEDSPPLTTFAGRLRSNSKAMKTLGSNSVEAPNSHLSPIQTNVTQISSGVTPTSATFGFYSNASANNSTSSSFPHSPGASSVTTQISGGQQTLADVHNPLGNPNAALQNINNGQTRDTRKAKVKKSDIGLPKLEHTTSTMPSSILIQAGPNSIAPPPLLLQNGAIEARQVQAAQAALGTNSKSNPSLPYSTSHPEMGSTSSPASKLKKSTSEGYGLNSKSRKDDVSRAMISPPPVKPYQAEEMPGMI